MIKIHFRKKENGLPILSKKEIESIAELILMDYNSEVLSIPTALDVEDLAENYLKLDMDYQDLTKDQSILGMTVFGDCYIPVYDSYSNSYIELQAKEGTIIIDNSLLSDNKIRRARFTLGHEIGHWMLHKYKYSYNSNQISFFDGVSEKLEPMIKCRTQYIERASSFAKRFKTDEEWIEWQADYFSSALLMPRPTFNMVANSKFLENGIERNCYIYGFDKELDSCIDTIIIELADIFDISLTATKIRLKNLGFIKDEVDGQQSFIF